MKLSFPFLLFAASCAAASASQAADLKLAAEAINALGVDLYHTQAHGDANLLLSPYSIQNALAMTYAGADGATRTEMQRVLHYPADEDALDASFGALAHDLADTAAKSAEAVKNAKKLGGPGSPIEFHLANRLFAQRGYAFRPAFLSLIKDRFDAPLEEMDYKKEPDKSREAINHWVEGQTKDRIRDLLPAGSITPESRLTLVNALYLRAPWTEQFSEQATKPQRFLVHGKDAANVPMMIHQSTCGYAHRDGFQAVTRTYWGGQLQFLIVLPDDPGGLAAIEKQLTPALLTELAHIAGHDVVLQLPRLRLEPPTMPLGKSLEGLGMKTAFDDPKGSANFDRMAPRKPNDYLSISAVFHKTFLALDEKGTEAAAATAVTMVAAMAMRGPPPPQPIHVTVDHPFLFAIQHVPTGACLFLGRVTDPR